MKQQQQQTNDTTKDGASHSTVIKLIQSFFSAFWSFTKQAFTYCGGKLVEGLKLISPLTLGIEELVKYLSLAWSLGWMLDVSLTLSYSASPLGAIITIGALTLGGIAAVWSAVRGGDAKEARKASVAKRFNKFLRKKHKVNTQIRMKNKIRDFLQQKAKELLSKFDSINKNRHIKIIDSVKPKTLDQIEKDMIAFERKFPNTPNRLLLERIQQPNQFILYVRDRYDECRSIKVSPNHAKDIKSHLENYKQTNSDDDLDKVISLLRVNYLQVSESKQSNARWGKFMSDVREIGYAAYKASSNASIPYLLTIAILGGVNLFAPFFMVGTAILWGLGFGAALVSQKEELEDANQRAKHKHNIKLKKFEYTVQKDQLGLMKDLLNNNKLIGEDEGCFAYQKIWDSLGVKPEDIKSTKSDEIKKVSEVKIMKQDDNANSEDVSNSDLFGSIVNEQFGFNSGSNNGG